MHFNPHEREARDVPFKAVVVGRPILIHTSVKLVTSRALRSRLQRQHFNPHEREARDFYFLWR